MKYIKSIVIIACIAFTSIVLFTSFSPYHNSGNSFAGRCTYQVDEIVVNGQGYIVATTSTGGIAICKE